MALYINNSPFSSVLCYVLAKLSAHQRVRLWSYIHDFISLFSTISYALLFCNLPVQSPTTSVRSSLSPPIIIPLEARSPAGPPYQTPAFSQPWNTPNNLALSMSSDPCSTISQLLILIFLAFYLLSIHRPSDYLPTPLFSFPLHIQSSLTSSLYLLIYHFSIATTGDSTNSNKFETTNPFSKKSFLWQTMAPGGSRGFNCTWERCGKVIHYTQPIYLPVN